MSARPAAASVFVTGVVVVAVWLTDLSFGRAALLAPVLVIGLAAVAGPLGFWGEGGGGSLHRARPPRPLVGGGLALLVPPPPLTLLGGPLPPRWLPCAGACRRGLG